MSASMNDGLLANVACFDGLYFKRYKHVFELLRSW